MTVFRTAGLDLRVALNDLATNWSDVDGDTVTLAGINLVTTNGVNLMTNGTCILYTNGLTANDQFTCSISDGYSGTNVGVVNIVLNPFVAGQNHAVAVTNGTASLTFYGIPSYSYITERTTNLVSAVWVDIFTNTAPTNGVINATDTFGDLGGNTPASAYYRLKWQQ